MSDGCVFCDRTKFEERLIGENKEFWFIATLGQITDGGYTLIIPKRHVPCIGAMTEQEVAGMKKAMDVAQRAIGAEYKVWPMVFEHGIVGQSIRHAHLHLVPALIDIAKKIRSDFPDAKADVLASFEALRKMYVDGKKYLLCSASDCSLFSGTLDVVWDPPAPSQYLRIVTAELTGKPERANWRDMNPELDKKFWTETVRRLKPYF